MKLLIAVKSKIIADSLASVFFQHDIHICSTGTKALAMLESLQPDILILDLCLPIKDGLSVLREARYKPPVILALTNFWTDNVLENAAAVGIQHVLLIPCTIRHIIEHLNPLIEKPPSAES